MIPSKVPKAAVWPLHLFDVQQYYTTHKPQPVLLGELASAASTSGIVAAVSDQNGSNGAKVKVLVRLHEERQLVS